MAGTATIRLDSDDGERTTSGGGSAKTNDSIDIDVDSESRNAAEEMATLDSVIMSPTSPSFIAATPEGAENVKKTGTLRHILSFITRSIYAGRSCVVCLSGRQFE